MLTDSLKSEIRSAYALFEQSMPDFHRRRGQLEMIACVAQTFGSAQESGNTVIGENIGIVEGKTGTGKTIGYLIPAIIMAKGHAKKLVVSTATVALQEQLFERDIPAVINACNFDIKVALAKGRGRYVCPSRLAHIASGKVASSVSEDVVEPQTSDQVAVLAEAFSSRDWNGEKDSLPIPVPVALWQNITTDSNGCSGKRCSAFSKCPYYAARAKLQEADLIVANHDLVLSSLTSDGAILPPPEDAYYVFDEAHHLPEIARSHLSSDSHIKPSLSLLGSFTDLAKKLEKVVGLPEVSSAGDAIKLISTHYAELHASLKQSGIFQNGNVFRFNLGALPPSIDSLSRALVGAFKHLSESIQQLVEVVSSAEDGGHVSPSHAALLQLELGRYASLARMSQKTWDYMSRCNDPPAAKWVELHRNGDISVHAGLIAIGSELRKIVWDRVAGAVLTSATLTSMGDFSYFRRRVGLARLAGVTEKVVASSFDYANQGTLFVPKLKHTPATPDAFVAEIAELLPKIIRRDNSGTLVLFQSRRQMEAVADMLGTLRGAVLMQGSMPQNELIEQHRMILDNGGYSVIFGLSGMGEGIDLPGRECEHVILTQIPFSPPETPLDAAMAEWIEKCGGNPFTELALPKASIILNQRVGRLIRREEDKGVVTILDSRLLTKGYGNGLIAGLPPMRFMKSQSPSFTLPEGVA